ncbi:MAG: hypothetical protein JJD92_07060 [Frankiaceae bacterium]|nr:hypothetical protein [Frankiaceae bacterium]
MSVFVAIDQDALRDLLSVRFARFPRIAVCRIGDLAERGVTLLPTGLVPHHDMVTLTVAGAPSGTEQELTDLLDRILAVTHTVQDNPYYDPREDRRDPH